MAVAWVEVAGDLLKNIPTYMPLSPSKAMVTPLLTVSMIITELDPGTKSPARLFKKNVTT